MSVRSWRRATVLAPVLCLTVLPGLARPQQGSPEQQSGDQVADAARKAREQKRNAPKPKKVYTEDDIRSAPLTPHSNNQSASQEASPSATTDNAQAGQADATGAAAPGKNDEASWRKRFDEQRNKITRAEKELDILQREYEKAQLEYYPDPQKALSEQNSRKDINDKYAKIDAKKQEIASLKKQLDDLEDLLRKSGGDPGWAR
jgi:DNA repair exonuclease SbcCD ATPase subunit